MKRRQIKIGWLFIAALVLVIVGVGGMILRPTGEPDQTLPSRFGDVVWNHELHAHLSGVDCTTCHHRYGLADNEKLKQGVIKPKPCGECHQPAHGYEGLILAKVYLGENALITSAPEGQKIPPSNLTAFHSKCINCHNAKQEGPTSCRDCHTQKFAGPLGQVTWSHREHSRRMGLECVDCHHQDTEAKNDGDYRACGLCHQPSEVRGYSWNYELEEHRGQAVQHGECAICHLEDNPDQGVRACSDCHAGAADQDKNGKPSLEYAVHFRCLECHTVNNREPIKPKSTECVDCHRASPSLLSGSHGFTLWPHTRHSVGVEWACSECHHKSQPAEPQLACRVCHSSPEGRTTLDFRNAGRLEEVIHKPKSEFTGEKDHSSCSSCHQELIDQNRAAGPSFDEGQCQSCHTFREDLNLMHWVDPSGKRGDVFWDHRAHADSFGFSCRECHHNTMVRENFAFTVCESPENCPDDAAEIQKCANCHPLAEKQIYGAKGELNAPPLGDAVHNSCKECHRQYAGPTECEECHQK